MTSETINFEQEKIPVISYKTYFEIFFHLYNNRLLTHLFLKNDFCIGADFFLIFQTRSLCLGVCKKIVSGRMIASTLVQLLFGFANI